MALGVDLRHQRLRSSRTCDFRERHTEALLELGDIDDAAAMDATADPAVFIPGFHFEPNALVLYADDTRDGAADRRRGKMPDVDHHAGHGQVHLVDGAGSPMFPRSPCAGSSSGCRSGEA